MDRKDFFRKIAHSIGDKVAEKIEDVQQNIEAETEFDSSQKLFLLEYTRWLAEFQVFVKLRNKNPFDIENNKKLMELSVEAEQRKPQLELHMRQEAFKKHFDAISYEITEAIA